MTASSHTLFLTFISNKKSEIIKILKWVEGKRGCGGLLFPSIYNEYLNKGEGEYVHFTCTNTTLKNIFKDLFDSETEKGE